MTNKDECSCEVEPTESSQAACAVASSLDLRNWQLIVNIYNIQSIQKHPANSTEFLILY